jgi:uncharacterized membrane protein YbaN (DUF454 family)
MLKPFWKKVGHVLRVALGVFLVILGIVGIILPFLPGWLFLAAGVVILAPGSRIGKWIRRNVLRMRKWVAGKRARSWRNANHAGPTKK